MKGAGDMALLSAEAPKDSLNRKDRGAFSIIGDETGGHMKLPSTMKMLEFDGSVTEVVVSSAGKVALCWGLPEPPGGWFGPFGFFRLVSYAFMAVSAVGLLLSWGSLTSMDCLGFFAGVLLSIAAAVCAAAAYSHEGLANEVTEVAKQNEQYAEKNKRMAEQVESLSGVAGKLKDVEESLGVNIEQLRATLDALHRQTSIQQLATLLRAFCDADRGVAIDQRLMKSEVEDFFDSSDAIFRGACPTFDFEAFKKAAVQVGIGIYAMRFMVNALIAAGDDNPHKSTAELSLIMFCFDPEGHLESCLSDLKLVLADVTEEELRSMLLEKKAKFSRAQENGRISCKDMHDISQKIMASTEVKSSDPSGTEP